MGSSSISIQIPLNSSSSPSSSSASSLLQQQQQTPANSAQTLPLPRTRRHQAAAAAGGPAQRGNKRSAHSLNHQPGPSVQRTALYSSHSLGLRRRPKSEVRRRSSSRQQQEENFQDPLEEFEDFEEDDNTIDRRSSALSTISG